MDDVNQKSHHIRLIVGTVASILLGLVFLASGSGKIIGFGEMPGQTMEFLYAVLPDILLTPSMAIFIGDILLPYIVPWAELCLGILIIIGIWPRPMAVLCLLLTAVFMVNNSWLMSQGVGEFPSCACFGIWEEIFGGLTPYQSFFFDIGLSSLALVIIFVYPGKFLSLPSWLTRLGRKGI